MGRIARLRRRMRELYEELKRIHRNVRGMGQRPGESDADFQRRLELGRRKEAKAKQRFLYVRGRLRLVRRHRFRPEMANGHPYERLSPQAKAFIARAFYAGLVVTATYEGFPGDGVHSTGSYHYLENDPTPPAEGRAVDVAAVSVARMTRFAEKEMDRRSAEYLELFSPADSYVKNGVRAAGHFPDHGDHVHGAPSQ